MKFTPEEIAAMAKEAGIAESTADGCLQFPWNEYVDLRTYLQHFGTLVAEKAAAKEREACATLIQLGPQPVTGYGSKVEIGFGARTAYAAAIRARGQKEGA